jgi:hypothetical protein
MARKGKEEVKPEVALQKMQQEPLVPQVLQVPQVL